MICKAFQPEFFRLKFHEFWKILKFSEFNLVIQHRYPLRNSSLTSWWDIYCNNRSYKSFYDRKVNFPPMKIFRLSTLGNHLNLSLLSSWLSLSCFVKSYVLSSRMILGYTICQLKMVNRHKTGRMVETGRDMSIKLKLFRWIFSVVLLSSSTLSRKNKNDYC